MSRQNVEIVRTALGRLRESYDAGEATGELLDMLTADLRVDASRRVFNPAVYEGPDGMRRLVLDVCDAWEDFSEAVEDVIEAGGRVVVLQTIRGRGRASGVEVEASGALVWALREGRVRRVDVFSRRDEALAFAKAPPPSDV
jgi:ketosteroid isomerase-like protein